MKNIIGTIILSGLLIYTIVGTGEKVERIKQRVPADLEKRGWTLLRYEGYQYGSWAKHGGKVWYHVCDTRNPSIQYRVFVCLWGDELQYYYNAPQKVSVINFGETKP